MNDKIRDKKGMFIKGTMINVGRKRPDLKNIPGWGRKKGLPAIPHKQGCNCFRCKPKHGPELYNWKGGYENTKMLWKKRWALKANADGSHTLGEWENLKAQYNWTCPACGLKEPFSKQKYQFLTEDHIVPLSKGGSDNIENIQPLCASCNSRKRTKIIKY